MTVAATNMRDIYRKLGSSGYRKGFVESLLPDWWDDDLASSPSGLQQTAIILSRLLGVSAKTLWTPDAEIELSTPENKKFKRRNGSRKEDLSIACAISYAVGKLALGGLSSECTDKGLMDAAELRQSVLEDQPWVGLDDLLGYCKDKGILVLHLTHFPRGVKKMEGLAFSIAGGPVIVLTQARKWGFLLFDLAHEIGHITLGHVTDDSMLVDQKIDQDSDDEDEKAANRFALELLTGDPDCRIVPAGRNLTGSELATAAQRFGREKRVHPAHVALNYSYTQKHCGVAANALNELQGDAPTDQELIRKALFESMDSDKISEDDLTALKRYCGEE